MFSLDKEKDIVDVYVRISFINMAAKNTYGIGLQYFSGRMMSKMERPITASGLPARRVATPAGLT